MIFVRRFPDLKLLCVYESFSFILRGHEFDNERILSSKVSYYAGMISFSFKRFVHTTRVCANVYYFENMLRGYVIKII